MGQGRQKGGAGYVGGAIPGTRETGGDAGDRCISTKAATRGEVTGPTLAPSHSASRSTAAGRNGVAVATRVVEAAGVGRGVDATG